VNFDLFSGREATPQEAREMIRAYYACISFVDAQVGRVLDALDRLNLRDNTIIVFFGDHGYHLGEKGKWSKHSSLYEVATRVPLIIAAPSAKGNGKASPRTAELLDIYPTLVELLGLPTPKGLEGQSLASLLKNPRAKWSHPAYSFLRNSKIFGLITRICGTVRTDRYRYTEWDEEGKKAELYDHQTDPHELRNLAADPQHAKTVEEMRRWLREEPK
ncbi:MAG: sulfatase-like hydrolase/transferase, partial [Nitrososphaera sp.]|nr:sulfatase-like hydrolase/transferase [Nitrososphaera sp.]